MTRRVLAGLLLLLTTASEAFALQAVAEVNEEPYYTQYKASLYGGMSLTRGYAPFPVFFEGWKSAPRADIVDYSWDFGDGSPGYRGFNAAHVYEKPGTYQAKLTVTDKNGQKATSAAVRIEVLERKGRTFYVDSKTGSDSNDGLSTTKPWKTATHAFKGLLDKRYQPGDRILFKRGQTFEVQAGAIKVGHYKSSYGYLFGAYGSGAKPIIQKVGTSTEPIIKQHGLGFGHVCFQDLELRLTSKEGISSGEFLAVTVEAFNVLFQRVDFRYMDRGLGFSGGYDSYRISGVFVEGCTMHSSSNVQFYARCARLALLNNVFDLSENHLIYVSYLDKGVIDGNVLYRPPFGRTALRISASSDYSHPSNNICVTDNWIQGWVDPQKSGGAHNGKGTRYNWELVDIGPNTRGEQALQHIAFQRNKVIDGETLLVLGDAEDVLIEGNLFYTDDSYEAPYRIQLGSRFESRPLKDIRIRSNLIMTNENRRYYAGIIGVLKYSGEPFEGRRYHEKIAIYTNAIEMMGCNGSAVVYIGDASANQIREVREEANAIYTPALSPGGDKMFMLGGDYVNGTLIDLPTWRKLTANGYYSAVLGTSINFGFDLGALLHP